MRTIKLKNLLSGFSKTEEYASPARKTSVLNESSVGYQKLDPAKYGHVIDCQLSDEELEMANDPDVKPFAHVSDSAAYVRKIRKASRP